MTNTQIALLITVGAVVAVLLIVLVAIPEFKKKNVNVEKIVKALESKGEIVEKAADELKPVLPKKVVTILDILEKWCPIGAGYAEQLAHTGDIDKEDRSAVAIDVVLDVLKELDIDVTDRRKSLIKAAIENAVNDLGHDTPIKNLSCNIGISPNSIQVGEIKKDENGNIVSVDSDGKETVTQIKADDNSVTSTVEAKDSKSEINSTPNGIDIKIPNAESAVSAMQIGQANGEAEKVANEIPKTVEERVANLENQINQINTNLAVIATAINPVTK